MRKYFSGTGFISVGLSAVALLKGMKGQHFTWRTAIAWLGWGLTLAMSLGILGENRKQARGLAVAPAEMSKEEKKLLKRFK